MAGASGALAQEARFDENVSYAWADVLRVDPAYETVRYREPQEDCGDGAVTLRDSPDHEREDRDSGAGGAVLGAIIGGVLGHQVGAGDGRRAATVAGAVVGGAIGQDIDRRNGDRRTVDRNSSNPRRTTGERRCRVFEVEREDRRLAGFDVEYRYKGDVFVSRLGYDPGNRLRVRVSVMPAE